MPDWAVAISEYRMERAARESLAAAGFTCYQPKFRERRIVRGRRVWVECLLLGRYLLVEMVDRWREMLTSRGVLDLIMSDERPMIARQSEVDKIRGLEVRGFVPVTSLNAFTRGQRVEIMRGSFLYHSAEYQERNEKDRDVVLLELLGQLVRTELPVGSLTAA